VLKVNGNVATELRVAEILQFDRDSHPGNSIEDLVLSYSFQPVAGIVGADPAGSQPAGRLECQPSRDLHDALGLQGADSAA
jgi:hypothetical protein